LYEPLFENLCIRSTRLGFKIRSIWIADAAHQGESGVINEETLGNDRNFNLSGAKSFSKIHWLIGFWTASWFDHARDIIALVNHFHEQMPCPIVGVGHSMGAGSLCVFFILTLAQLALM
jgi:hypothetical protein